MTCWAVVYPQCSPVQSLKNVFTGTCFPPRDNGILDFMDQHKSGNMPGNPRQLLPLPPFSNVAVAGLNSLRCFTKLFSKCGYFLTRLISLLE